MEFIRRETETIAVVVELPLSVQLREIAKDNKITLSVVLRTMLVNGIKAYKADAKKAGN